MARTIQSPGVEINEVDLTLRADTAVGTSVLITGFANQGPIDEVLEPTSLSEFEQIYGLPTNSAESYFYHSVKGAINSSPAKVLVSRLPYGQDKGDSFSDWKYSALVYPVMPKNLFVKQLSSYDLLTFAITNSGKGYSKIPNIYVTNSPGTFIVALTADDGLGQNTFGVSSFSVVNQGLFETKPTYSIDKSFLISNVVLGVSGNGYLTQPEITLTTGSTYSQSASAVVGSMVDDGIGSFAFNLGTYNTASSGSGFNFAPIITVTNSSINAATFIANLANDDSGTGTYGVSSITVTNAGNGYKGNEPINFSITGGGSSTSQVLPVIGTIPGSITPTFGIGSINIIRYGKGYDVSPQVNLSTASIYGNNASILVLGTDESLQMDSAGDQYFSLLSVDKINPTDPNPGLFGYEYLDKLEDDDISLRYYGKTCFIGKPTHIELSLEQYQAIQDGNLTWSNYPTVTGDAFTFDTIGESGMIILNESQTTVNNAYEGYYMGIIDNSNYNPSTPFNGILNVAGIQQEINSTKNYVNIAKSRLSFPLSASNTGNGNSISEVMENLTNYDLSESSFGDVLSLGVFKLRKNVFTKDIVSLDYNLSESYVGSINYSREIGDSNGGNKKEYSIEKISRNSNNIHVLVNPNMSERFGSSSVSDTLGNPVKRIRVLTQNLEENINSKGYAETPEEYAIRVGANQTLIRELSDALGLADSLFPLGIYNQNTSSNKNIGNLPKKLERVFELVDNADVFKIDIAAEAGLGTIYVNAIEQSLSGLPENYSASTPLNALSGFYITNFDGLDADATNLRNNYTSVANTFINFAEKQRKDFLVILDPLRNIFIQGENSKIINSRKVLSPFAGLEPNPLAPGYVIPNFSQHIYWPLRHQFGTINCSYATTYSNWVQVADSNLGGQIWIPFSGIAAGIMANTDATFQPWYAPAGFTRGIVTGVNDLAIYPKQKQRDQLYKISMNPIAFFPNEGFVVFGQKTLLKKPSAFDRINVRRLFLNLEKATKNTAKFFVFEPNTLFTRTQVINVLAPIFENAKNTEGLYDYRIVCDERNNTPDVIDNNELKIDIYIQPVRTAEFILVNFYATRTGTNFDELIGK